MFGNANRSQPSAYPPLPFHLIRLLIAISAAIVAGVLSMFVWEIHDDHEHNWSVPVPIIVVLSTAVVALAAMILTTILFYLRTLRPHINLLLNAPLLGLWSASLILMATNLSSMLSKGCNKETWTTDMGVSVCRFYKGMFSFVVAAWAGTAAAVILDVRVWSTVSHRGKYNRMKDQNTAYNFDPTVNVSSANVGYGEGGTYNSGLSNPGADLSSNSKYKFGPGLSPRLSRGGSAAGSAADEDEVPILSGDGKSRGRSMDIGA